MALADTLLEKMQGWGASTYGDLSVEGIEAMHFERLGDTVEQIEALTVTKRLGPSGESPSCASLQREQQS